jgi:Kef-type K+ transport system membrane component KefB
MMPRGEVGLVFAAIGRTLGVIDDAMFSAIVLMVMVTTLIAPPFLKSAVAKQIRREKGF